MGGRGGRKRPQNSHNPTQNTHSPLKTPQNALHPPKTPPFPPKRLSPPHTIPRPPKPPLPHLLPFPGRPPPPSREFPPGFGHWGPPLTPPNFPRSPHYAALHPWPDPPHPRGLRLRDPRPDQGEPPPKFGVSPSPNSPRFWGADPPSLSLFPPTPHQERVAELSGVPPEDQVLLRAGTPLDDDAALAQSPLPEFATLDLSTRLLGGNSGGEER